MSGSKSQSETRANSSGQSSSFIDPSQQPYLDFLRSSGQGLAQSQLQPGGGFQQGIMDPSMNAFQGLLSSGPNPELMNQIGYGQQQINENLQQNILPSIGMSAGAFGQRGGGRQGVAEGIAMRDASRQGGQLASDMLSQDYQQRQQRALGALSLAPMMGGLGFSPLSNLAQLIGNPAILSQATNQSQSRGDSKSVSGGVGGS